jgi:hypothetical protein
MKLLPLIFLAACSSHNRASQFAERMVPRIECLNWGSYGGNDIAMCEADGMVWHCKAGIDAPACTMIGDTRAHAPPAKMPAPADAPQLAPPAEQK